MVTEPGEDVAGEPPGVDLRVVLAEIDTEVRARRASGDLPPDFERSLDEAFARFAPVDAVSGDFDGLVAKLAETSFDTHAPTESLRPGGARVKQLISRAIDWELRHLANQIASTASATTRALRLLGGRVDDLERNAPMASDSRLWALGLGSTRAELPPGDWSPVLRDAFAGSEGPVVHAEAVRGQVLRTLRAAQVTAYGIDPEGADDAALDEVLDIRPDDTAAHFRGLPSASVAGIVLSGCVDRWHASAVLELVQLATSALVESGQLVVIAHHPTWWGRNGGVVADLCDGRPWAPSTWEAVLAGHGYRSVAVREAAAVPGDGSPAGYAVVAQR